MVYRKIQLFFVLCLALPGCATNSPSSFTIEFDHDVSIVTENDRVKNIKRGEPVDLPANPLTITRPDHTTVILLPIPSGGGRLNVRLPKEGSKSGSEENARLRFGEEANRVAQAIVEIQNYLVEKRADEALLKIQIVRERHPDFSYLKFLEASCFVVKNDLKRAQTLVEEALKEFPNDAVGREFIAQIGMKNTKDANTSGEAEEGH